MTPLPEMPDTWTTRHGPVLHSIVARFEIDGQVTAEEVADDTGLSLRDVQRAVEVLDDAGYVTAGFDMGGGFSIHGVSTEGREKAGAWPTPETFADRLLEVVERGLVNASTPEERTRWQKLKHGLSDAGRDILVNASGSALGGAAAGGFGNTGRRCRCPRRL